MSTDLSGDEQGRIWNEKKCCIFVGLLNYRVLTTGSGSDICSVESAAGKIPRWTRKMHHLGTMWGSFQAAVGVKQMVCLLEEEFPDLELGYFNQSVR